MPEITLNKLYNWTWAGPGVFFVPTQLAPDTNGIYFGMLINTGLQAGYLHGHAPAPRAAIQASELQEAPDA